MPIQVDISEPSKNEKVVIEAGADDSLLAISSQPGELSNLEYSNAATNNDLAAQNAVSNQAAIAQIGLTAVGKAVQMVSTLTPMQARSEQEILTGNPVAGNIVVQKAVVITPPFPRVPLGSPVYANMPVYLKYNNELGLENLKEVVVNAVQTPIPSGKVYGVAPVYLSYPNADGLANVEIKDKKTVSVEK